MTASLVETTRKRQLESKEAPGLSRRSSYVSHIRLENIRGFGPKFDLNLSSEEDGNARRRTLIIGQNGTCKTTLLRCIALSMCWREDANALLAEQIGPIIAQDCEEGAIEVHLQRGRTKSVIRNRVARTRDRRDHFIGAGRERNVRAKFPFICAVGAGRSGEGADPYRSYQVVDSVYSLFNYESTLTSVELCLHRLRNFRIRGKLVYRPIMNCIKSALKLPPGARFELGDAGGVFISGS